jgi:hypothetical protein
MSSGLAPKRNGVSAALGLTLVPRLNDGEIGVVKSPVGLMRSELEDSEIDSNWSCEMVGEWTALLGLSRNYAEAIKRNHLNGDTLLELQHYIRTGENKLVVKLLGAVGVTTVGDQLLLIRSLRLNSSRKHQVGPAHDAAGMNNMLPPQRNPHTVLPINSPARQQSNRHNSFQRAKIIDHTTATNPMFAESCGENRVSMIGRGSILELPEWSRTQRLESLGAGDTIGAADLSSDTLCGIFLGTLKAWSKHIQLKITVWCFVLFFEFNMWIGGLYSPSGE